MLAIFDYAEFYDTSLKLSLIIIILISLLNIMVFALSKLQLKTLFVIMRRTYAFEVLYGLVVLIISFSFIFYILEESFVTFGDALWYSFAVVTTIGFGDYTTISRAGRILTVILGLYGIVVVSMITSVIVNFYNEIKNDDKIEKKEDKKPDDESIENNDE